MRAVLCADAAPAVPADHERRTWAVAAVNGVAMAVLVAGGLALNSAAVLAEGLHMSAHLGALAIGAAAYRVASRLRRRAGRRVIDLAGLANAALLMLAAAILMLESLAVLRHPKPINLSEAMGLAVFGFVVNVVSLSMLHRPDRRDSVRVKDLNFRVICLHMVGDAAVGLISIVGLLLIRLCGWSWADGVTGLLGAALLAILAVQIVSATGGARLKAAVAKTLT